ncbi:MAG: hypothetical protein EBX30_14915 [Betaproteobacteria bacterium]|nr:hypothetical protein [Betaproteobacteria bacterium]NDG82207.1 hypothetical protein [Betaproteobacteria bacterium]
MCVGSKWVGSFEGRRLAAVGAAGTWQMWECTLAGFPGLAHKSFESSPKAPVGLHGLFFSKGSAASRLRANETG